MDEALKARLIGATVLVLIAVLLIPELLSGRKAAEPVADDPGPRGSRTFTIELGGGAGQSVRTPTTTTKAPPPTGDPAPATMQAAPQPSPAIESTAAAQPAPAAEPAAGPRLAPVDSPPSAAKPSTVDAEPLPAAASSRGGWAVQVGAFGNADTAAKLVRELSAEGYRAFVAPLSRGGKTLHRVRVGPEADQGGAEQLARRLKGRGLPATVVQND